MFPTELVFIDVETTAIAGPDADTDAIIEVAAARVDLRTREITGTWSTLIAPTFGASDPTQIITGTVEAPRFRKSITWRLGAFHGDRFDGVDFERDGLPIWVALDVLQTGWLRDGVTVAGQNPSFDLRHLRRDVELLRKHPPDAWDVKPWPKLDYHQVDLVSPSFLLAMTGAIPGCSLRHTARLLGREQKHRALDDVRDAIAVFWMLADMMARGASELEHDRHVREQEARR